MTPHVLLCPGSNAELTALKLRNRGARLRWVQRDADVKPGYRWATHVLILGGADIDPEHYGQTCTWARPVAPLRDARELPLARWALADGKPLLGICRGHQIITVAAGGTLYQDLEADCGEPHARTVHRVRVLPNSRIAAGLGRGGLHWVNSYHHQAVRQVPPGWRVVAESLEGVVEAIEPRDGRPVWSVQWHPEALSDMASARLLAAWLHSA